MKKEASYYGGFFWLALLSFAVPIFVGLYAFDKVSPKGKPVAQPDASGVDHALFDYILKTYVENGLVDYEGISRDYTFNEYLKQIASARPELLSTEAERLALHCNAYNALVINGVITHKIHKNEKNVLAYTPADIASQLKEIEDKIKSEQRSPAPDPTQIAAWQSEAERLQSGSQFFDLREHLFAGETISLNHLEHTVIRPTFKEPRIHVALVCAAKSCPAIRPEAYVGERLDDQLADQANLFANNPKYVRFSQSDNEIQLSPILSWYGEDWGAEGPLPWLANLVQDSQLRDNLVAAHDGQIDVSYNAYDWTLNSTAGGGSSGAGHGGGFGSGSVPNE